MKKITHLVLAAAVAFALTISGASVALADGAQPAPGDVSAFAKSTQSDIPVEGAIYPIEEAPPSTPPGSPPPDDPPADDPPPGDPQPGDPPSGDPQPPGSQPPAGDPSPEDAKDADAAPPPGDTPPATVRPAPSAAGPTVNDESPAETGGSPAATAGVNDTAQTVAATEVATADLQTTDENGLPAPDGERVASRVGGVADRIADSLSGAGAGLGAGLIGIINDIAGTRAPLTGAGLPARGTLALTNLLCAAAGAVLAVCAWFSYARRRRKEAPGSDRTWEAAVYKENDTRRGLLRELLVLAGAAAGAVLLALTQDLTQDPVPADGYTIPQAAILAATLAVFLRAGSAGKEVPE
jgi:hypothetical protein